MKALLRLKGKIRPRRKLSAVSYQPSTLNGWQLIKYCALDKVRYLRAFLQSILVFVSCSAALAQESVVHTTPANQAEVNSNKITEQKITPLKIGDKIPDELWEMYFPVVSAKSDQVQYLSLGDFKDKLIILDFWATWCAPCIENFPKLHALQTEFGDQIKIIAVTQQKKDIIDKFFTTSVGKEHSYVHSVIDDSILSKHFPHKGVPHIAWISPTGKVHNTTRAEDVSRANIQAILDNEMPQMVSKIDIDRNKPLFLSDKFGETLALKNYSIFVKGHYPGLPSGGNLKKNKDGKVNGRQFTNLPILRIYSPILYSLFEANNERYNSKRAIIEVKEPTLLNWVLKNEDSYEKFNVYSYELIVPENKADSLYSYMLADLNRYSDYTGFIENRTVDCLVLVRTSNKDKIKSNGGKARNTFPASPSILNNGKLNSMINMLNGNTPIKLPIIDETGYDENVDIEISSVTDLASLRKELHKYDLDLIETKRKLTMFILKDK